MASRHFVLYVHSPVFLWLISTQIFAHLYQHQACWYLHELQDFCLDMQVRLLQCCWCSVQCLFHSNNGILNILGDRSVTSNDLRFRSVTSNRNSWNKKDLCITWLGHSFELKMRPKGGRAPDWGTSNFWSRDNFKYYQGLGFFLPYLGLVGIVRNIS
jgi:hypothetical protein